MTKSTRKRVPDYESWQGKDSERERERVMTETERMSAIVKRVLWF